MSILASSHDASIVEFGDYVWVDAWWQRQRRLNKSILEFGDQFGFPVKSLDLPRSEDEGCYGNECCALSLVKGLRVYRYGRGNT